jgi:hypothetical protein
MSLMILSLNTVPPPSEHRKIKFYVFHDLISTSLLFLLLWKKGVEGSICKRVPIIYSINPLYFLSFIHLFIHLLVH